MEQTFQAKVTDIWSPGPGHREEVTVETIGTDFFFESSFLAPTKDCPWQVGDEVEIVLRKKTKETPHD